MINYMIKTWSVGCPWISVMRPFRVMCTPSTIVVTRYGSIKAVATLATSFYLTCCEMTFQHKFLHMIIKYLIQISVVRFSKVRFHLCLEQQLLKKIGGSKMQCK